MRHHLDVFNSARGYEPIRAGLAFDLCGPCGPIEDALAQVDPRLASPPVLNAEEFAQLVDFLRNGLLDPRATPERLKTLIPKSVPSGRPVLTFEPE